VLVIPLWADLLAVGLGGVQGALFASGFRGDRRLDLLGVAIIGIVMGMGGGLIRDLLLDALPVTLQSNWYLLTATAAALVGMLLAGLFRRLNAVIVGLDAVVIGLFGAFGTSKALTLGLPMAPAIFVGVCSALTLGGLLAATSRRSVCFQTIRNGYLSVNLRESKRKESRAVRRQPCSISTMDSKNL